MRPAALDLAECLAEAHRRGGSEWLGNAFAVSRRKVPLAPKAGELLCEHCEQPFRPGSQRHRRRFCSRRCSSFARHRRTRAQRTCVVCWRDFWPRWIRASGRQRRRSTGATCSERCRYQLIQDKRKVTYAPRPTCHQGHAKLYSARMRRWICPTCRADWSRARNQRLLAARRARGLVRGRSIPWAKGGVRRLTPVEIETLAILSTAWQTRAQLLARGAGSLKPTALNQRLARLIARGLAERRSAGRGNRYEWRLATRSTS